MGKFDGVLLCSDMDGTLLDDNKLIGKKTVEALHYFAENGGWFSLATGRTRPSTAVYRPQIPCKGPNIYLNGAILCDERDESVIFMEGLDDCARMVAKQIMLRYPHIGIEVFLLDHSYVCNMSEITRRHFENLGIPYIERNIDTIPEDTSRWGKINFTGETEQVEKVREELRPMEEYYNLTFSTPVFYEMTCKGGHKGDGVRRAAEYLGVKPENIYTVGDSQNDIPMLKVAEQCFVPENGRSDVIAMADVVVSDNNHDALADVVAYLDRKYQ